MVEATTQGQRPGLYQPGAKPQVLCLVKSKGLKARLIGITSDEPGLQPSNIVVVCVPGLRPRLV
jgi:hypothetical protein